MKRLALFNTIFGLLFTDTVISQDDPEPLLELSNATLIDPGSDAHSAKDRTATERLVFASFRPANWDIYYVAGPGAPVRRLTEDPALDYDPALSPDGRWVVFTSERLGNPDLFVLDLESEAPPRLLIESEVMEDQAAFSPDGKTLYFVSTRDGTADIYSLPFRPDRTQRIGEAVNLTLHPAGAFRPAISHDGTRIAFSSDRDHPPVNDNPIARQRGGDIYLMKTDGSGVRRLTRTEGIGWSGSPAWSPDGSSLYFYRREGQIPEVRFSLWAMDADGGNPRLLLENDQAILSPAVAPDGRIFFAMGQTWTPTQTARYAIWSVSPDGSDLRMEADVPGSLTSPALGLEDRGMVAHGPGPVESEHPRIGPGMAPLVGGPSPLLVPGAPWQRVLNDRRIELYPVREIFAAAYPSGEHILRTIPYDTASTRSVDLQLGISRIDGGGLREVTTVGDAGFLFNPVTASPDGEWIVYLEGPAFSGPDEKVDLWRVRADGSEAMPLTDSPANDGFASFSGDGRWMAFRSGRDGNFDIFRMDEDGSNVRNLTRNPARDTFPAVSPAGDRIVFMSDRDSPEYRLFEIYLMELDSDGSPGEVRRITHSGVQNGHPHFSPDGEWIAFTSEMGGINDEEPLVQSFVFAPQMYGELYAYRITDGKLVCLTHDKWEDGFPSWVRSPGADTTESMEETP